MSYALKPPSPINPDDRVTFPVSLAPSTRLRVNKIMAKKCRVCAKSCTFVKDQLCGSRAAGGLTPSGTALLAENRALMPLERDERADRHVECPQFRRTAQVGQVDDEAGGEHVGAELA